MSTLISNIDLYPSMSKEQAIANIIPIFRQYGYEGTTLSMLAKATGLGKASLYHYFPQGKEAMAGAVIDYISYCFKETVLKPLHNQDKPAEKIHKMCHSLKEFYRNGKDGCFLAIMSFGEADNLFHAQVKQRLQTWLDTLAQVLIEGGIEPEIAKLRSQNAIVQIQGALILVRILDNTAPFEQVIINLPGELLSVSQL